MQNFENTTKDNICLFSTEESLCGGFCRIHKKANAATSLLCYTRTIENSFITHCFIYRFIYFSLSLSLYPNLHTYISIYLSLFPCHCVVVFVAYTRKLMRLPLFCYTRTIEDSFITHRFIYRFISLSLYLFLYI